MPLMQRLAKYAWLLKKMDSVFDKNIQKYSSQLAVNSSWQKIIIILKVFSFNHRQKNNNNK